MKFSGGLAGKQKWMREFISACLPCAAEIQFPNDLLHEANSL